MIRVGIGSTRQVFLFDQQFLADGLPFSLEDDRRRVFTEGIPGCLLSSPLSMTARSGLPMMPQCPANHLLDECFLREGRRLQRRESVEWVGRRWLPPAPSLREKSRNSSYRYLCAAFCVGSGQSKRSLPPTYFVSAFVRIRSIMLPQPLSIPFHCSAIFGSKAI